MHRMKEASCEHKDNGRNALCSLGDGVGAEEQCQTQRISGRAGRGGLCVVSKPVLHPLCPLPQLTARPNPSWIVAQNLIYLLQAPLAVPGELLQHTKAPQRLHHRMYRHAAVSFSCVAANTSHCFSLLPLPPVLALVVRPASQGLSAWSRRAPMPQCESPHIDCLLQLGPIYRDSLCCSPRAACCSVLLRRLHSSAASSLCNWIADTARS